MPKRGNSTKKTGDFGEDIACRYLEKKGFRVVERNYWRKWGEIDIIAQKGDTLHFVEVKAVTREREGEVPREPDTYRPEENVHPVKLKRLHRAIETYLAEKGIEGEWQVDVVGVFLFLKDKKARCRILQNVL